jgi:hypothetical protein
MSESGLRRFDVHVCALDAECRLYAGSTWRLHVNTPWWHVGIALRPADRFVRSAGKFHWLTAQRL